MNPAANDAPVAPSIQIPPEILSAVFSQINLDPGPRERGHVVARFNCRRCSTEGDEVLRHVSLTCWSFHDLALPIRFRHVKLCTQEGEKRQSSESFARLAASDRLRNLVQFVSLQAHGGLPESAEAILCGMPNLKLLDLVLPFNMTQPLYNHICSLRSLHRLEVAIPYRRFGDINPIAVSNLYRVKLYSVVVTYGQGGGWYGRGFTCRRIPQRPWDSLPPWLISLALSPSVRELRLPLHAIPLPFTGFTSQPMATPPPHLVTFNGTKPNTTSEWEEFRNFVAQTPLVTNLILDDGKSDDDDDDEDTVTAADPPFPSNLLPTLKRFEGDLCFARLVVPGRPVSAIELISLLSDDNLCHLRPLTLSTAAVRSLIIHDCVALSFFAAIATLFSDLVEFRALHLGGNSPTDRQEWLNTGFVLDIEKLGQLRSLRVDVWGQVTTDQEKDALSRLSPNHPLEHVTFGSTWLWFKLSDSWTRSEAKS